MAISERLSTLFKKAEKTNTNENLTLISAGRGSEGETPTGEMHMLEIDQPKFIQVKIVGDRNMATGEITHYHQEIHGTVKQYART